MSKIITHFLEELNSFSNNIYYLNQLLEPLLLGGLISEESLEKLEKICFNENIDFYTKALKRFNKKIKLISKELVCSKARKPRSESYATFTVDKPAIIIDRAKEDLNKKTFEQFNQEHINKTGRSIEPIFRRKEVNINRPCPHCGAPVEYLYEVEKGRCLCKVCNRKFGENIRKYREIGIICPYCHRVCNPQKKKETHDVYKCNYHDCPYFVKNYKKLNSGQKKELRMYGKDFKLHYIHREYKIDFEQLEKERLVLKKGLDIRKLHHSQKVVSLCATFNINYGLSSRKTALLLKEVFGVKISHMTVTRYVELVSSAVHYVVDNHNYELTDRLSADETYVDVKGEKNYAFFFSDPIKKIITSYNIFKHRNTVNAIKSIYNSIIKYKEIPEKLNIVVDANPIYRSAQVYFGHKGIHFDINVVVGLQNSTPMDKKYRQYKQIQERLNRTFKYNYNPMTGFKSLESANSYMVAYVAFFNFLRPHSSLNYRTPVQLDIFNENDLIYDKWTKLIDYSISLQKQELIN